MEAKILLVEDDPGTRTPIKDVLIASGMRVLEAESKAIGLDLFRNQEPDLAVLDVHLPDGTGLEICEAIRKHKSRATTPIIMLTGAGKLEDKEQGFHAGADHYLVKPVHPKELLMWVQALLRRLELDKDPGKTLEAGDVAIDLDAHVVRFKEHQVSNLTNKEFELLYFLVRSRPKVLSRKHILSKLWHTITVDRVVDTHMGNLRRKLPAELADRLQAVTGKGFRYMG